MTVSTSGRLLSVMLFLLACLASISACGRGETQTLATAAGRPADSSPESGQAGGGGALFAETRLDVPDLAAALQTLDSYRLETAVSFSGQDSGGRPLNWQLSSQIDVSAQQAARRFDLQVAGLDDGSPLQAISAARIGAESFLAIPGVGCVSGLDAAPDLGQHGPGAPTTYLAAILGAELAGPAESMSGGIFHFDQKALPGWPAGAVTIDGRLLIRDGSAYPSHVELTATGSADYLTLGRPQTGTLQLTLDVSQVNVLAEIQPPAACVGDAPYPIVADAFALTVVEGFVSYSSRQSFGDILAFYQAQMPAAGWVESEAAIILEDDEPLALLTFQRRESTVTISISLELASGTTTVLITP